MQADAPDRPDPTPSSSVDRGDTILRVALFNIEELSREKLDSVAGRGGHPQLGAAAEILLTIRPDILVLQEVDHSVEEGKGLDDIVRIFQEEYLESGPDPLVYPHRFVAPNNTGDRSGFDLNGDGVVAGPEHVGTEAHGEDSWGFGIYPGQYSMAVLSRFPLPAEDSRTFQHFAWSELPGNHMPPGYFPSDVESSVRLSSKSHWDLPVDTPGGRLHLLVSHPTPPAFDGPEGRNRRRNFDEILFWVRYLDNDPALWDDQGRRGGWNGEPFLVAGDLNADPWQYEITFDGTSAIGQLLERPELQDPGNHLVSAGATRSAGVAAGPPTHQERNTAPFLGGRRVDYLLPDARIEVLGGGVHWPDSASDPEGAARAALASDHRLVWLDVAMPLPGR